MCRLNRLQASFVVIGVGVVVTIVAAVMAFYGFDNIIENQINDELVLKEDGGEAYDNFKETPIDVFINFYLFNITNPDDLSPDWKPQLQEVGPYVYREKRYKENITFSEDGKTVDFLQYKSFTFDANKSYPLTQDDELVMINAPVLGVLSMAFGMYAGPPFSTNLVQGTLVSLLGGVEDEENFLFLKAKVNDVLFTGASSPFLKALLAVANTVPAIGQQLLSLLPPNIKPLENGEVGFALYPKDNEHDGLFSVFTGKDGMDNYQSISAWNGKPSLEWWYSEECNLIQGTDGTVFKPFIDKDSVIWIFTTDTCRSLYSTYSKEVSFLGIDGYRFNVPRFQLENSTVNEYNQCFCIPTPDNSTDGCMGAGVINLIKCMGVPVYLSQPHFLYCDEKYLNAVEGLAPDPAIHETFLDIEPLTGVPLRASKRVQMNFRLMKFDDDRLSTWFGNLTDDLLLPLLWVDEYGELTPDLADEWKSRIGKPLEAIGIVKWVFLGLGVVVLSVGLILLINAKKANSRKGNK